MSAACCGVSSTASRSTRMSAKLAGREAVTFAARHHRFEAWFVPASTLIPVLVYLGVLARRLVDRDDQYHALGVHGHRHGADVDVFRHRTLHAARDPPPRRARRLDRLSIASAGESSFSTRLLLALDHHDHRPDDRDARPPAGQRHHRGPRIPPDRGWRSSSFAPHSIYITLAAVITGVAYMSVMAGSLTKRDGRAGVGHGTRGTRLPLRTGHAHRQRRSRHSRPSIQLDGRTPRSRQPHDPRP